MVKRKEDKTHGTGVFIDVGDSQHVGLARVRPPRAENLSEADSVAAMARLKAPSDQILERPLEDKATKHWPKKSLIKGKKNKLSIMGLNLESGDPRILDAYHEANNYRKTRMRELVIAHGYVSSGVASMLATSALALASSRLFYERAAETGDMALFQQAGKLATDSRQNELSAWELCRREAIDRRRAASEKVGVPWLKQDEGKKKPGRPRKDDKLREELKLETIDAWTQPETKSSSGGPEKGSEEEPAEGSSGSGDGREHAETG